MLFECSEYYLYQTRTALGGMNDYLQIDKTNFQNLQEAQTYINKMWKIILNQSLGKPIRNDSDYKTIKQSVMNILGKDKYFYEKR